MKKRLFCLLLTMAAVFSLLSISAAAETEASGTCGENLTWTLEDGVLTIRGTGEMEKWEWGDLTARPWYSNRNEITSVVIKSGVTSIGAAAFYNCSSLTSVTIPDSVTSIGEAAFHSCNSLTAIDVDSGNTEFRSVDGVLFSGDMTELICYPMGKTAQSYAVPSGVTSIGEYAFSDCDNLTSITIPNGVTSIGDSAFEYCSSLTSITIPNGVTSIGDNAFAYCSSLTSITIPNGVTSIGDSAFEYCSSLTSITIPNGVTSIGEYAFEYCESLTSVTIPDGVMSIGDYAFNGCSSLTSVTIPNSVTNIGVSAFGYCYSLTSVTIPDGVMSIGDYAFNGCSSLTSVTIPNSVTSIGDCAFTNCDSLTAIDVDSGNTNYRSVDGVLFSGDMTKLLCYLAGKTAQSYAVPGGVTSIGDNAFWGCSDLTSITIPDSVTSIDDGAFMFCFSLTSITIPDSVTSIGDFAFYRCYDLADVYYGGSEEDWGDISIGLDNNNLTDATIHFGKETPKPEIKRFNDVSDSGEYYYAPVYWAVEKKITKGTGDNQFSPEDGCTRAQVVTFLWRAAGEPEPTKTKSPFTDVQDSGEYYYKAVLWAMEKGITTGATETTFEPEKTCTRAQIVTFLWRYEGKPAVSGSTPFTDVNRSEYYDSAVLWAVQKKVTLGTSDTTFEPENTCTRAQVVTFLYRDLA